MNELLQFGTSPQDAQCLQLWEYDEVSGWHEIKTRGCIPDKYTITGIGSQCVSIDNKVVVFGSLRLGPLSRSTQETSSGVFLLDMAS